MEKYNQFNFEYIKKLIRQGAELSSKFNTVDELVYNTDFSLSEFEFVQLGFENPDFIPEIHQFYRIGEPVRNIYGTYSNSRNAAEDVAEYGVSVVTTKWLNNFKSVFFGTSDENISARGVYKITGFALPYSGGDDEILICPLDWAEKTKIKTRSGLAAAVKKAGF